MVENVPLPAQIADKDAHTVATPSLPSLEFTVKDEVVSTENHNLPDLSDLFNEEINEQENDEHLQTVEFETPELPDIDGLF